MGNDRVPHMRTHSKGFQLKLVFFSSYAIAWREIVINTRLLSPESCDIFFIFFKYFLLLLLLIINFWILLTPIPSPHTNQPTLQRRFVLAWGTGPDSIKSNLGPLKSNHLQLSPMETFVGVKTQKTNNC